MTGEDYAPARGPAHLVALEKQLLSYRANKSIEGRFGGLPGALQPATVDALRKATTYCWSADCVEGVSAAGRLLPGGAQPTLAGLGPIAEPHAAGWFWFERPIPIQTTKNAAEAEPVVALLWRREVHDAKEWERRAKRDHPGTYMVAPPQSGVSVTLTWFSCFVDMTATINGRTQSVPTPSASWLWLDDWTLDEFKRNCRENYDAIDRKGLYGLDAAGNDVTTDAAEFFSRFWLAAGLWLQQRVITRERTSVPRQPGRALARQIGLDRAPQVEVVYLRRPMQRAHPTDGMHRAVDWQWRWLVGGIEGFWRNQYHPSRGEHVLTYIAPYWKGPEDKPIKAPVRIYAVNR